MKTRKEKKEFRLVYYRFKASRYGFQTKEVWTC